MVRNGGIAAEYTGGNNMENLERLQKYLAKCGICSRRKAEEYIKEGRVTVNGKIVSEMGVKVGSDDTVCFDGRIVLPEEEKVYILMNKPEGCVTTVTDDRGRKTVMDYIRGVQERIFPIGRLDYNTSGLLFLTNDGELANRLTHPRNKVDKVYEALVQRVPSSAEVFLFENGMYIDGRKTAPAKLETVSEEPPVVRVTIHEGRNRQVRKMLEEIDNKAINLKRISIGNIELGGLKKGRFRYLDDDEISYLKSI